MEIDHTVTGLTNLGEIKYYIKKNYQNKIVLFVKLVSGICETWKNCRKVTCQRSRNFQYENRLKTKTQFGSKEPEFKKHRMESIV